MMIHLYLPCDTRSQTVTRQQFWVKWFVRNNEAPLCNPLNPCKLASNHKIICLVRVSLAILLTSKLTVCSLLIGTLRLKATSIMQTIKSAAVTLVTERSDLSTRLTE